MKRIIISACIFALLITLSVYSYFYITNRVDELILQVQQITDLVDEEKYSEAAPLAERVSDEWDDFCSHRLFIIDNQHIMEITNSVARIQSMIIHEEDDCIIECETTLVLLDMYKSKQKVSLYNIL